MEQYKIVVANLESELEEELLIEVDEAEASDEIVIKALIMGKEITASNDSYLQAYQEFRDRLLSLGYGMKCNGSRINAVQSGMLSSVSKVYLVEMGRAALMKDVVNIFDFAELNEFPNTEQQESFFEQWSDCHKN